MERSCDRFRAQTTKIWPFEAAGALGTAAAAEAQRRSGDLSKQKCILEVPYSNSTRGPVNDPREYYRGGLVSLPISKCPGVTQGSPGVAWLVLGPHHGDSHTQGSRYGGRAPKEG